MATVTDEDRTFGTNNGGFGAVSIAHNHAASRERTEARVRAECAEEVRKFGESMENAWKANKSAMDRIAELEGELHRARGAK